MNPRPEHSIRTDANLNSDTSELDNEKRPSSIIEVGRFSERLRATIGKSSVRAFAQGIGVSPSVFHQYLNDKSEPTRPIMNAIAKAGGVNLLWLAAGEGPMHPGEADGRAPPDRAGPLDAELLKAVIVAVQDAARSGGYDLSPSQQAELITGLYECFGAGPPETPIPRSAVDHLLRAIKLEKKEKQ